MDRAFASGAAGSAPAAPARPSIGFPTAGNPATSTPATKPGPYWYHMITEELRAVIVAAGLTPDHTKLDQLATAIALLAVVPDATETLKGKIELATAAEAQALTDAVRAITPLRLKEAMQGTNMSLSANGYQKLPSGLIVQWVQGATSTAGEVSEVVTLPITFPNSNLFSSVSSLNAAASQAQDTSYQVVSKTTSQVTVFRQQNPPNSAALAPLVFAIGY